MCTQELNVRRLAVILFFCGAVILLYTLLDLRRLEKPTPNILDLTESDISKNVIEERGEQNNIKETDDVLKEYNTNIKVSTYPRTQQRGEYWVLYNYVRSSKTFLANESITYTTHGDFTFLDNLEPLLERWLGPVSIALYAPGDDFQRTIDTIRYLRDCTTTLIKELVTFHIYFKPEHLPKEIPVAEDFLTKEYNCNNSSPHLSVASSKTYKAVNKLTYPINVARNVAKETAQTHFVLASDIELYPSANIIPNFLDMISNISNTFGENPVVFPLNLFEVKQDAEVPSTKTELKKMLANKSAVPFHKKMCSQCHNTPHYNEWVKAPETQGLHVFFIGKRASPFQKWEPIYIGTRNDPAYDERLSWEGKSDKMTQGYILCVKDYDFMILDNAFLVHRPGIKSYKKDPDRSKHVARTNSLIKKNITKELKILYGGKKGCVVN